MTLREVANDAARQQAVDELDLASDGAGAGFERIVRLAHALLKVPICAFSVIDRERVRFPSAVGLPLADIPREGAFCQHTVTSGAPLVVDEAHLDERFRDSPLVAQHGIDFYAGTPVFSPSRRAIGALCVMDRRPHPTSPALTAALADFALLLENDILLRSLSVRDPLTGLFNRRHFEEAIARKPRAALRTMLPLTALTIDCDGLDELRARSGADFADHALARVAGAIQSQLRGAGDILFRMSAGRFLALLPTLALERAEPVGERVRKAVEALGIPHADSPFRCVTVTIGGAHARDLGELGSSCARLLELADGALYEARLRGGNRSAIAR